MTPIIYIVTFLVTIIVFLRIYCRLTVGRYHGHHHMSGKTVLITGASAGLGKATAMDLARRNARVLLACRNLDKAEKVKSEIISITGNTNVVVKHLDLESFDSVRKCAEDVLKTEKRLDVLINNAGVALNGHKMTKDGHDLNMQTNYLGHFLLTLLLLDLLKKSKPSRIINVTSIAYLFAFFDMDDMEGTKDGFILNIMGNFYHRTKLAIVLFTRELSRRLKGIGVTVNCLHPGVFETDIIHNAKHFSVPLVRIFMDTFGKTIDEGAQTSIYLAVDPSVQNVTGKYFSDCRERRLYGKARDKVLARKVFELSEKIVGARYESL